MQHAKGDPVVAPFLDAIVAALEDAQQEPVAVTIAVLRRDRAASVDGMVNEAYPFAAAFQSDINTVLDIVARRGEPMALAMAHVLKAARLVAANGPRAGLLQELESAVRELDKAAT